MITAEEARQKARESKMNTGIIIKTMRELSDFIDEACSEGKTEISYKITDNLVMGQIDFITEDLEKLGYTVKHQMFYSEEIIDMPSMNNPFGRKRPVYNNIFTISW